MESFSYLLFSGTGKKQKTYIGATNNPDRRLKQHNGLISGGAYATKGREWTRAVYVGGFPDWTAALQFEWSWKRHSRKKYGLEGKLQGLVNLLNSEKSTSNALPFSLWPSKIFLRFTENCPEVLEKIEGKPTLLRLCAPSPPYLPNFPHFPSITMSSSITSVDLQSLSAQITALTEGQKDFQNQIAALRALVESNTKKPRTKKADGAESATETGAEKPVNAKKPRAKKAKSDEPKADEPKADEPKAEGTDSAVEAEKPAKKPRAKKVAVPKADGTDSAAEVPADADKPAKKPRAKKADEPKAGEPKADGTDSAHPASDAEKPAKKPRAKKAAVPKADEPKAEGEKKVDDAVNVPVPSSAPIPAPTTA